MTFTTIWFTCGILTLAMVFVIDIVDFGSTYWLKQLKGIIPIVFGIAVVLIILLAGPIGLMITLRDFVIVIKKIIEKRELKSAGVR